MEKKSIFSKWKTGLGKTRTGLLARLFASKDGINEEFYEELEEALILAMLALRPPSGCWTACKRPSRKKRLPTALVQKKSLPR